MERVGQFAGRDPKTFTVYKMDTFTKFGKMDTFP